MTSKNRDAARVLVTAALPYSNGRLHVGHIVGAYLPADTYVRFLRLQGKDVRFVCGSDDHGVAIMLTAQKEGKSPSEVAKYYNESQKRAFEGLRIEFDIYSSTSRNPYHARLSQKFFSQMLERGFFEKQRTRQFFDPSNGTFLPDRFVKGTCGFCGTEDQNGDQCESCGKMLDVDSLKDPRSVMSGQPATSKETVHWFIDLSRFEGAVAEWLKHAEVRDHTRKYVEGLIGTGLVKRSMTRDLTWGVPVPLADPDAKGKVLYVWFDAPIGYISNTEELCAERDGDPQEYLTWWGEEDSEIIHFIGEDNTVFHCLVWIAMLAAEGSYRLPKGVIVNQFMNIQFPGKEETKISKSRGTAVWIEDYLRDGGNPEALRYYLTVMATERSKTAYNPEDLLNRQNTDLANTLGNFVNRVLSFSGKHFGPNVPKKTPSKESEIDRTFQKLSARTHEQATEQLRTFQFKAALEGIMEFARACNKYVDDKQPWTARKTDPEGAAATLAYAIDAIKALAIWLTPFMPTTGERIAAMLNLDMKKLSWDDALKPMPDGAELGTAQILFAKSADL